jgi:hypothetical protein
MGRTIVNEFDIRGEVNVPVLPIILNDEPTGRTLQGLRIGGRPVPLDAFRRIPCAPIAGEPLGWVNYHWDEDGEWVDGGPLHVVWLNRDGELRRALVDREPPAGVDPAAWEKRYAALAALTQLYLAT